jgi:hypothetical protein
VYFDGARIEDVNYALDRGGLVQRGKRDKHMIKAST